MKRILAELILTIACAFVAALFVYVAGIEKLLVGALWTLGVTACVLIVCWAATQVLGGES